jgi:hypothetical protein
MVTVADIKEAIAGMQFQYGPASYFEMQDDEFEAEMERMYGGFKTLALVAELESLIREFMTYEDGRIDHLYMSAGECAVEVLDDLGFVEYDPSCGKWILPRPSDQEILEKITE